MASLPLPKGYQRLGNFPIDETSVFETEALLNDYIANNGSCYVGQTMFAKDSNKFYVVIDDSGMEKREVGSGDYEPKINANGNYTFGHIIINDAGANEGIKWNGGNGWGIFESPNVYANSSGNLQIDKNGTRHSTFGTDGSLDVVGGQLKEQGQRVFSPNNKPDWDDIQNQPDFYEPEPTTVEANPHTIVKRSPSGNIHVADTIYFDYLGQKSFGIRTVNGRDIVKAQVHSAINPSQDNYEKPIRRVENLKPNDESYLYISSSSSYVDFTNIRLDADTIREGDIYEFHFRISSSYPSVGYIFRRQTHTDKYSFDGYLICGTGYSHSYSMRIYFKYSSTTDDYYLRVYRPVSSTGSNYYAYIDEINVIR